MLREIALSRKCERERYKFVQLWRKCFPRLLHVIFNFVRTRNMECTVDLLLGWHEAFSGFLCGNLVQKLRSILCIFGKNITRLEKRRQNFALKQMEGAWGKVARLSPPSPAEDRSYRAEPTIGRSLSLAHRCRVGLCGL